MSFSSKITESVRDLLRGIRVPSFDYPRSQFRSSYSIIRNMSLPTDDFLKEITSLLQSTDSLLMDFNLQSAAPTVINLDDSDVIALDTTEDEPSPQAAGSSNASGSRRGRAASGRVSRRGRTVNSAATARPRDTAALVQSIIDLSNSPVAPLASTSRRRTPPNPPARRNRRGAAAFSLDDYEDLEDSVVMLNDPFPSYNLVTEQMPPPAPAPAPRARGRAAATASTAKKSAPVPVPAAPTPDPGLDSTNDGSRPSCPICLCNFSSPVSTMCGHVFCKACLAQWLKNTKACPVCKSTGAKLKTHPIFM